MKLSMIRAAAKLFGLTATLEVSEEPDCTDDDVVLSNGVRIQRSGCGTPLGIHCTTEIPEWTSFDKYWEGVPSAAAIIIAALELRKKVDAHNAEHATKKEEVLNG
jgi:hypothetical protein